jgi:hypothetical protein
MIRGLLKRHPVLSSAGGFALGWSAMAGNLWAILASLGAVAAYRDEQATEAARAAAIECGKTDPACVQDIQSPECIDHAKAAAVAAGLKQRKQGTMQKIWIVAGIAIAIIALVQGIGHHVPG